MPKAPKHHLTVVGTVLRLLLATCFIALIWWCPWILIAIIFVEYLFLSSTIYNNKEHSCVRQFATERQNESICSFARSFNCRTTDTWVIRAVYEELQLFYPCFPLRATDRFKEDLHMDDEDLADIGLDMAYRSCRSMKNTEMNPMFGNVKTVGDLVRFLNGQPRKT
jgi:hypothetical protein